MNSMATATMNGVMSCLGQIGDTAGTVWHALNEEGPLSLAKLFERVGGNRDVVMQAVGWLAREGKIDIVETKRGRIVSLRA
jgi:predicted transcriptional regulator